MGQSGSEWVRVDRSKKLFHFMFEIFLPEWLRVGSSRSRISSSIDCYKCQIEGRSEWVRAYFTKTHKGRRTISRFFGLVRREAPFDMKLFLTIELMIADYS